MGHFSPLGFLFLRAPDFLVLYGLVAILVLACAYLIPRFADKTSAANPPRVPQTPDPIEAAYLSGGVNNVIRTVFYDLRQRGFATLEGDAKLKTTALDPAPGELSPLQSRVLRAIAPNPKISALFSDVPLRKDLERLLEPLRQRLAQENLLAPPQVKTARNWTLGLGLAVLIGLAGAKLFIAFRLHIPNVAFLIILSIVSVILLIVIAASVSRRIASRRGRAWLEALRLAYAPRLASANTLFASPQSGAATYDAGALFLIGLFGFEALKGTPDENLAKTFKRAGSDGGGGCGGGCGGGGGDGGGGCGGCGGGGD
ncbi:MAG: TIGR04222 domain-containing membrane protein [Methylocystis sp.]